MNTQRIHFRMAGYLLVISSMLIVAGWWASYRAQPVQAQDLGLTITKSLQGSSQVQVGQILEFTIELRNTGSLTLTRLVVVDEFVPSIVAPSGIGQFAEADDPPLTEPPAIFDGTSIIRWENALAATPGGVLPPGETLTLRVRLRAVRPTADLQVVNRARVAEAIRSDGSDLGQREAEAVGAEVGGANAPVEKRVAATQPVQMGQEVPFEIEIRNAGLVDLESVPISDFYDPSVLQFLRAVPQPSSVNETQGVLEWDDLLAAAGVDRLRPGETIRISTVYLALRPIDASINQVRTRGVRDRYDNEVEAEQAEVPIQIVPAQATATATSLVTETATATATSLATLTATSLVSETVTATSPTIAVATATRAPRRERSNDKPTRTVIATATPEDTATAAATATTAAATAVAATSTTEATGSITATATPLAPIVLPTTGAPMAPSGNASAVLWGLLAVLLLLAGIATRSQFAADPHHRQAINTSLQAQHILLLALLAAVLLLGVLLLVQAGSTAAAISGVVATSLHPHTSLLTTTLGMTNTAYMLVGSSGGRMNRLAADEQVIYAGEGSALSTYRYTPHPTATDTITPLARLPLPGLVEAVELDAARADAYVATGSGGVQVVDVQDPAQPALLGSVRLPGTARDLSLNDGRLFVVATGNNGGIHVVDVQDPAQPHLRATLAITGAVQEISVAGDYAYVAAGFTGGLVVLDVSSTLTPTLVGRSDTDGLAQALAITGTTLLLADGEEGVRVYDVSNPTAPRQTSRIRTAGPATDVTIRGDLVAVAVATAGVQTFVLNDGQLEPVRRTRLTGSVRQVVATSTRLFAATGTAIYLVDCRTPTTPRNTGTIHALAQARSLAIRNGTLLVAAGEQGVLAYALTNPLTPTLLSQMPITGTALELLLRDDLLYVAAATGGIHVLDVARPQQPQLRSSIPLTGSVVGLDVTGRTAYAALGNHGVQLIDLSNVIDPPAPPLLPISGTLPLSAAVPVSSRMQGVADLPLTISLPFSLPTVLSGTLDVSGTATLSANLAVSGSLQLPPPVPMLPLLLDTLPLSTSLPISGALPISLSLDLAALDSLSFTVTITAPVSFESLLPISTSLAVAGYIPSNGVRPTPDGTVISDTIAISGEVQSVGADTLAADLAMRATLHLSDTSMPVRVSSTPISVTVPPSLTFSVAQAVALQTTVPLSEALPPVPASPLSNYDTPGNAFDVRSTGNRAYVADGRSLQVLSITRDLSPTLAVSVNLLVGNSLQGLQLAEGRLYAVDGGLDSALAVFDLSSSFTPTLLGRLSLVPRASPYGLRVLDQQQVVVAAGIAGVQVIDTSNPQQLLRLGSYDTPGVAHDLALAGDYMYVADYDGGLQIWQRTLLDQRLYLPLIAR